MIPDWKADALKRRVNRWLVAVLMISAAILALLAVACQAKSPRNVLIIMWDTVRADRLSSFGYSIQTTPRIDRYAEGGTAFRNMISTSNWTVPSHASIFTGHYPEVHQAVGNKAWLDDRFETLAEVFGKQDYDTWFFSANPFISAKHNMTQGFDTIHHPWQSQWSARMRSHLASRSEPGLPLLKMRHPHKESAPVIGDALLEWIDSRKTERPFFAFINLMEAHWPWHPTREERSRFLSNEQVDHSYRMDHSYKARYTASFGFGSYEPIDFEVSSGLYDAALWHLDQVTGQLLDQLYARGLDKNTLIVLVADHGDNLGDHGLLGHEYSLHQSLLHVPLIVLGSDLPQGFREEPIQSTDLFDLVLTQSRVLHPGNLMDERKRPGTLLSGAVSGPPLIASYLKPKNRAVDLVSGEHPELDRNRWLSPIHSIQWQRWKLIRWDDGRSELYDLSRDPHELKDLSFLEPDRTGRLLALLEEWRRATRSEAGAPQADPGDAITDPEHLERLKALGYAATVPESSRKDR